MHSMPARPQLKGFDTYVLQPLLQIPPLRLRRGHVDGRTVRLGREREATEASQQIRARRGQAVIATKYSTSLQCVEDLQAMLRTLRHGDGDRAVQLHNGRWLHAQQDGVQGRDLWPVSILRS